VAKQIERLAPLRGLNPTNVGEEAALQGTFMRGGYNVEVIDAEWWVRHGCGQVSNSIGSIWWRWMISSPIADRCLLVSNNYVIHVDEQFGEPGVPDAFDLPRDPAGSQFFARLTIPYLHNHTMNVTFTYGSVSAVVNSVSGGTQTIGQIFQIPGQPAAFPDQVYRIIDIPNAGLRTLDRPFARFGPGTAATVTLPTVLVHDPCISSPASFSGDRNNDSDGGCVLFEQTATHAVNSLGYVNDAVSPGSYIIIVVRQGYAAVPITGTLPIVRSFLRQTQLPAPTPAQFRNMRPGIYKDRLFMQADDPNGAQGYRTFWYSRPFDFMQWHTGLQGLGGTANYFTLVDPTDPISGMLVQGDMLIVHRRSSQDMIQTYGAGFKATHNDSGIGFWPRSQMESIPTGHIGWTRYGPGLFNQQGMTIMFPELERMLAAFNQSERMNPRLRGVIHDLNRRRIYFLLGWETTGWVGGDIGTPRIIRHQDAGMANRQEQISTFTLPPQTWYSRSPVLVVDYARNEAWIEDHAGLCGGGEHLGQMYLFRYDGTVLNHPTGWSGKDYDVGKTNAKTPVDAMVETQWMIHGSAQRKMLQKIYLQFRTLDVNEDVDEILGGKFNPLRISDLWGSPTDTLHLCTVEVMCDNRDDVQARSDVSVLVSDMLSRSLEGNRMLPVMLFSITPRVAGRSFKYRFKTALSPAAAAAGHKVGSFRLVDAVIEFEVETDTRAAGLTGGSP